MKASQGPRRLLGGVALFWHKALRLPAPLLSALLISPVVRRARESESASSTGDDGQSSRVKGDLSVPTAAKGKEEVRSEPEHP